MGEARVAALRGELHLWGATPAYHLLSGPTLGAFFLPTVLQSQREPPLASPGRKELLFKLCKGPKGAARRAGPHAGCKAPLTPGLGQ